MPADFRRVEEIYFAVSALPAGERPAALAAMCGTDVEVRKEVDSLLEHETGVSEFMSKPALGDGVATKALIDLAPAADRDDLIGQRVGKYKIEARIASGGMGTVYLAVRADEQFEQQVALKVVKRGMDTEEILARFKAERQTLAHLNHENIARVIDGGMTGDGRPYLVMEYVKGEAIDEYCDRKELSIDERLRLFRTVCEAVRYAHQNLVVHRDLKPGNILVTEEGVPKLLDFGIAKVLTRTRGPDVTAATERRLTPEYASPEQISGAMVTTSSDVYSLGVILYELLTGRRPFDFGGADATRVEQVVMTGEVVRPSVAVMHRERGEGLGQTLSPSDSKTRRTPPPQRAGEEQSKGMTHPNPVALGAGAERLAKQLRGDLDTIVLAAMHKDAARRYPSVEALIADVDRYFKGMPVAAKKDTLRYRVRKFVRRNAVGVAFAGTAAVLVIAGVAGVVWQARAAVRERDEAERARDQTEEAMENLAEVFAPADAQHVGFDSNVRQLMEATERRVENELRDEPLVQAVGLSSLGHMHLSLGALEKAESFFQRSYQIRRQLLPPVHHDIAESLNEQGELAFERRQLSEAERLFHEALAIYRGQSRPESLDTAKALNNLGSTYRAMRRLDEAERTHREALALRERLKGRESIAVAESLNNLANVLRQQGRLEEAIPTMREALDIRRKLRGEDWPLVLQSIHNLAVLHDEAGHFEESKALFEQMLGREGTKLGADNPAHGTTLRNYGMLLFRNRAFGAAEAALREAYRIHVEKLEEKDVRRMTTEAYFGRCLVANGKWDEGIRALGRVLPRMPKGTKKEQEEEAFARAAMEKAESELAHGRIEGTPVNLEK